MLAKSYHAVGIQEILTEVEVPKGSFYHYFESKEAFGVAIIDYYAERLAGIMRQRLSDIQYSPRERIRQHFIVIRDYYGENGCERGCLIAKLATEVAAHSTSMRDALKRGFDQWTMLFSVCIKEGQANGEISSLQDADFLAEFLLTSWEGALMRMQANQELSPLHKFIDIALDLILPPAAKNQ